MERIFKWKYKPSGNCPVQAEGWFLGYYFYFRARWSVANIVFYENEQAFEINETVYVIELKETENYLAGWLTERECISLIRKGCWRFFWKFILWN